MLPPGVVSGASRVRGTRLRSGVRGASDRSRSVGRAQPAGNACSTTGGGWVSESPAGGTAWSGHDDGTTPSAA